MDTTGNASCGDSTATETKKVSDRPYGSGRKIICIGECALDIFFEGSRPAGSMPGGRIANAASILAEKGREVHMVGEAGADPVGDIVVSHLESAGVDTAGVDRFTDGHTPVNIFTTPDGESPLLPVEPDMVVTRYENYPPEGFDVVWPRIDEGDIVVFGGYYAISQRNRARLSQFLSHLAERKAVIVYLPGFLAVQEQRITRVMPAILENLELADVVITRSSDLHLIFGIPEADRCYADRIDFYCRNLINIDAASRKITYYSGSHAVRADIPAVCESMMWNAGAIAGILDALFSAAATVEMLGNTTPDLMRDVIATACSMANNVAAPLTLPWQRHK